MYANVFQKGEGGVELFTPNGTDPFRNVAISTIESLASKLYDRSVKGYIISMIKEHPSSKFCCPKQPKQTLGIIQTFLCFQVLFVKDKNFSVEIVVSDENNMRKRLIISTAFKHLDTNELHARIPLKRLPFEDDLWATIIIDLHALTTNIWRSFQFKSLESFSLLPSCKIRKIFSLPKIVSTHQGVIIPVNLDFPLGVRNYQMLVPPMVEEIESMPTETAKTDKKTPNKRKEFQTAIVKSAKLPVDNKPDRKVEKQRDNVENDVEIPDQKIFKAVGNDQSNPWKAPQSKISGELANNIRYPVEDCSLPDHREPVMADNVATRQSFERFMDEERSEELNQLIEYDDIDRKDESSQKFESGQVWEEKDEGEVDYMYDAGMVDNDFLQDDLLHDGLLQKVDECSYLSAIEKDQLLAKLRYLLEELQTLES